jgi:hydrogenase maturation protein HypF
LPFEAPPLLAAGPELKNTFCLTRGRYAFLSQHIGDLENFETLQSYETGIDHFERLFHIRPEVIAYDLHPNYLATRYALDRAQRENIPAVGVQHHHAHIAACMAEHGFVGELPVIGVAFDGTGYGEDGAIWGGEFLIADYLGFQRFAHLAYVPLPGGDAAVRKPARTALSYLWRAGLEWEPGLPCVETFCVEDRAILRSQLERGIHTPLTSSMGRLFDAVAALAGVRQKVNYEAQAAIELEAYVDPTETGAYPFEVLAGERDSHVPYSIDASPLIQAVLVDYRSGIPKSSIAARFHNSVAQMVLHVCSLAQGSSGITQVVLSGGVWQNHILLTKTIHSLEDSGFKIYYPQFVPANDGGVSLGQAAVASYRLKS